MRLVGISFLLTLTACGIEVTGSLDATQGQAGAGGVLAGQGGGAGSQLGGEAGAEPVAGSSGISGQSGAGGEVAGGTGGAGGQAGEEAGGAGQGGQEAGGAGQGGGGAASCTPSSCDDQNVCTTDVCEEGVCQHTPDQDASPKAVVGNCQKEVCSQGKPGTVADDSDLPADDSNPCTQEECKGGVPTSTKLDGTMCQKGGKFGTCKVGECLIECSSDGECNDQNVCTTDACVDNKCSFTPLAEGTPTPGVTEQGGDCQKSVCQGGLAKVVTDDGDVPAASDECHLPGCKDGTPSQTEQPDGTACTQGGTFCLKGACKPITCGDGVISTGEQCEVSNLGGQTCASYNPVFSAGTQGLACNEKCQLDDAGCRNQCGNGVKEMGEECDGADLGGLDCAKLPDTGVGGKLACKADCKLDASGCAGPTCSDKKKNNQETDQDCGGQSNACLRCPGGEECALDDDCISASCSKADTEPAATCKGAPDCSKTSECMNSGQAVNLCVGGQCLRQEASTVVDSAPGSCPGGWTEVNGRCYVKVDAPQTLWYDAFRKCRQLGANLAIFETNKELEDFQNNPTLQLKNTGAHYLIGLVCRDNSQCQTKSQWSWMSNLGASIPETLTLNIYGTYDAWGTYDPFNNSGMCGVLRRFDADMRPAFAQTYCSQSTNAVVGYICEQAK